MLTTMETTAKEFKVIFKVYQRQDLKWKQTGYVSLRKKEKIMNGNYFS